MEDLMPIRIRHRDNKYQDAQIAEFDSTIAVLFDFPTASYADWKPMIRILCGSIELLLASELLFITTEKP